MGEAKRKLAAILAADVAGYSRLMGADEEGTVAALDACRAIFKQVIESHDGQVVDTAGDSVLATFDSVVEAVRCAVEVQSALAERDSNLADDRRTRFRIGVNLGDVIAKADGTVYGDGVNVAARLESLADPGGICISSSAHEQVEGKTDFGFQDIGEHEVKNIARPVRAHTVIAGSAAPNAIETPFTLPDKPSIAVLPFDNLSGNPQQEYFADGIAEDLISALSRFRWLLVTARNSTFTYKGKPKNIKQVGREMGVRYVLEGSVRKGGNRVRVTAQLIDATTGNHVWAERYDRELADLFELQDEISETITDALEPELRASERDRARRKPTDNLGAWESYQRGLWSVYQYTAEDNVQAQTLFRRAIELDANFASGHAGLAYSLALGVILRFEAQPVQALDIALGEARLALRLDEQDSFALMALGRVLGLRRDFGQAIQALEKAVTISPSSSQAHYSLGFALAQSGDHDRAIESYDKAIRLSPRDANLWGMEIMFAHSLSVLGRNKEALVYARRSVLHTNAQFWAYAHLASILGHLDRIEEAGSALEDLYKVQPDFDPQTGFPWSARSDKHFQDGLYKAGSGIPDEPATTE